jgi:hypothetical protein
MLSIIAFASLSMKRWRGLILFCSCLDDSNQFSQPQSRERLGPPENHDSVFSRPKVWSRTETKHLNRTHDITIPTVCSQKNRGEKVLDYYSRYPANIMLTLDYL